MLSKLREIIVKSKYPTKNLEYFEKVFVFVCNHRILVEQSMEPDPKNNKGGLTNGQGANGYNHLMPGRLQSPPPMPWFGMDIGKTN